MIYYLIASILIAGRGLPGPPPDQTCGSRARPSTPFRGRWSRFGSSPEGFTATILGRILHLRRARARSSTACSVIVSAFAFFHSKASLPARPPLLPSLFRPADAPDHSHRAGAYFASNLAVTWIFLEATTLCSAGIIYHRRTAQALEAAWKYVFVCSTGIAMAYLGILLLAAATKCETLSYEAVAEAASSGNPLYLKTVLSADSQRIQLQGRAVPALHDGHRRQLRSARACFSADLDGSGQRRISRRWLRVYKLLAATEVFPWVKSVLLLVGVLSLVVGALFLRRTNNYKRFLSYSTVENMGIAAIGLGIGGIGVWAALFHVFCHTLVKEQSLPPDGRRTAGVWQLPHQPHRRLHPHQPRRGGRRPADGDGRTGGFPPSPLFLSELMILKQVITDGRWWLVTGICCCSVHRHLLGRIPSDPGSATSPIRTLCTPSATATAHSRGRRCRCSPSPSCWACGSRNLLQRTHRPNRIAMNYYVTDNTGASVALNDIPEVSYAAFYEDLA